MTRILHMLTRGRIKQDAGERGWVPAWFIGKVDSGSGSSTDSQPSSAATLTGPAHGSLAESANIGEGREEEAGGAG